MRNAARSIRTSLLNSLGRSWLAKSIAAQLCKRAGVQLDETAGILTLTKGDRAIDLQAKHLPFVLEIAGDFDAYFAVCIPQVRGALQVADYATHPEILNIYRRARAFGISLRYVDNAYWIQKDNRVMLLAPRHFVYVPDMAEKFEIYFSPVVPTERGSLKIVDYSRPGILQTYAKSGLQFEMASFPEEEEALEEYFRWYTPKPGDTVFDLGAHCGVSTCMLARLVGPEGRVISFEPDPMNYSFLVRNIERHGHKNVVALNIALSGSNGTASFNGEGTIGSGLTSLLDRDSVGTSVQVETVTLQTAFERWGTPVFCKMDIEGAEIEVLASSIDILKERRVQFALDTHHFIHGELTNTAVEQLFARCGYEAASERNPLMTTWARPR